MYNEAGEPIGISYPIRSEDVATFLESTHIDATLSAHDHATLIESAHVTLGSE